MATFIGRVEGMSAPITRTGSRNSGIMCCVQSYGGSVSSRLYMQGDVVYCRIVAGPGSDPFPRERVVYDGSLAELLLTKW